MIYLTLGCGLVSLIAFLVKCFKQRSVVGVFLKNLVSIFFILTAVSATFLNPTQFKYGILVICGLVFGMLGDIYLDQKWVYPQDMAQYLYAGFITFLIGHTFYITALYKMGSVYGLKPVHLLISIAVGVVICVGNLILEKPTKQNFGKFKPILSLYSLFVGTTPAISVVGAIVTYGTDGFMPFVVFAIGGVFFLISDLVLSPMYFGEGKNTPANFVINHVTYYIGQYLFALSIVFLPVVK